MSRPTARCLGPEPSPAAEAAWPPRARRARRGAGAADQPEAAAATAVPRLRLTGLTRNPMARARRHGGCGGAGPARDRLAR